MANVRAMLALVPARSGSKGIPNKNWKVLWDRSPVQRAIDMAQAAGLRVIVSADDYISLSTPEVVFLDRPAELAQDDTPMIDVVKHALAEIPGPDDQIILLVQPTQVLRQPKHLAAAIQLLEETKADSVVSVVELPKTHHPGWQYMLDEGRLVAWDGETHDRASRRQDLETTYIRDGTCYCFRRSTVSRYGTMYGVDVRPLIIDPSETCALDTMADWHEAERRLKARDAV